MNISVALKLWGNPTSGSKDACICSFGWVFYCKIEEIKRSGQRAGNDGEKNLHSFPSLPARVFFFFWFGFPQPPGGVMTRRTVFTRKIITVVSVFARSYWLLYP